MNLGPAWHSERRESPCGSLGTAKQPIDTGDDVPGAYAVMAAADRILEDPEDMPSSSLSGVERKACIKSNKRLMVAVILLCCAILCTVLAIVLSQRHSTATIPAMCNAPPTDPFLQCDMCGQRISELSGTLRSVYDSVRKSAELRDYLEDNIDIRSCSPVSKALVWIVLEAQKTVLPPERIINRFGLALLYASMGGEDWTNQDGWLSDAHECGWYGVECSTRSSSVLSISLPNNGIHHALESSLGLLPQLRSIDFSGNDIVGSIPSSIFDFPALGE